MQEIFAVTLASMHQDMARLDGVALNLANVSTPGYKRGVVTTQPFSSIVDAAEDRADLDAAEATGIQVLSDMRPGTVKLTGEVMDVALAGDGFFEVTTPSGPAYTRQGNFRTDALGRLVTAQGYPVMGKNGEIFLTTQTPVIDAAGNITEPNATTGPSAVNPGTPIAQLKVVRFDSPKTLLRLGEGMVAAGTGMAVVDDAGLQIRQGALENGNVNSMQEMMQLIQTMRHFESMQKMTQGYDDMLGTAIRKLGDLS
ncbi:flagellar hook-basal body protein [Ralstonia pseudosolanacearum]|uniref:flagellar hook-basal body protein n=1 Tax=Ralstonia pseudosolanacearum TaxID=1310165 RepID=UPI003AB0C114